MSDDLPQIEVPINLDHLKACLALDPSHGDHIGKTELLKTQVFGIVCGGENSKTAQVFDGVNETTPGPAILGAPLFINADNDIFNPHNTIDGVRTPYKMELLGTDCDTEESQFKHVGGDKAGNAMGWWVKTEPALVITPDQVEKFLGGRVPFNIMNGKKLQRATPGSAITIKINPDTGEMKFGVVNREAYEETYGPVGKTFNIPPMSAGERANIEKSVGFVTTLFPSDTVTNTAASGGGKLILQDGDKDPLIIPKNKPASAAAAPKFAG